jgi:methylated-DNA-protein-cysteine methyltransferase-like protein
LNERRPFSRDEFDSAVWAVVAATEPGRVMSYGQVARRAGYPRHARMVGRALGRSRVPLPWYRVVRSDRTLAFAPGSDAYERQKASLENEGVRVVDGKAVPTGEDEALDMDRLLWGPEEIQA